MRAGLDRSASHEFDTPTTQGASQQHQLAQEHDLGGQAQQERDRQRQRQRELDRGHDGTDIGGMGR